MSTKALATAKTTDRQKNPSTRSAPVAASPLQEEHTPQSKLHHLQRKLGNQRVGRLMQSGILQARLQLGKPNDKYEQEADSMADKVMRMPSPAPTQSIQREATGEVKPQAKPLAASITPLLQQKKDEEEQKGKPLQKKEEKEEGKVQAKSNQHAEKEEEKPVQRKEAASGEILPNAENDIAASRGKGKPLPKNIASDMGGKFGADFSGVRVHTDSRAASLAAGINAQAFTMGKDVYFNSGHFNPDTSKGKHLLAHELTHVVQQNGVSQENSSPMPLLQRKEAVEEGAEVSEADKAKALKAAEAAEKTAVAAKSEGKKQATVAHSNAKAKQKEKIEAKGKKDAATASAVVKKKTAKDKENRNKQKKPSGKASVKKDLKNPIPAKGSDKAPSSPEKDPAFQTAIANAKTAATERKTHKAPTEEAKAAQDAAVSPPEELAGKAQDKQAGEMEKAETPTFNAAAFKAQLMQRIASLTPKTTQEADDFKGDGKAASLKEEMQGSVTKEKDASQGALQTASSTPPDPKGAEPKETLPLQPAPPEKPSAPIGAENAVPKPKGKSEIEQPLQENSKKLDDQMKDANITEKQLATSNEPAFQSALKNKKSAQDNASKGAENYRKSEQGTISQAKKDATASSQDSLSAMQEEKIALMEQVAGKKEDTKSKDELERKKIGDDIDAIYQTTKKNVDATLEQLDKDVATTFDKGAEAARKVFEDYIDAKMTAYKEERYGGWLGWAKWAKDKLVGMPPEVDSIFVAGRDLYLSQMEAVIDSVVEMVGSGLTKAKSQVAEGKKRIADYVAALPDNLKQVGQDAATEMQGKFDELESGINSKQDALIDSLANKYKENLEAVDARVEEMKAANKGLVDKAIDAVAGVINTILELKNMLNRVLAKVSAVVSLIISDPIGFLGNLVKGLKMGFDNFVSNILKHLQAGLIGWLTGSLGPMGITIPDDVFSLKGIFSLVMQVLGLTWDYIRGKAVKLLGEPVVKALETGFEVFQILIKEGPAGLWNWVKEQFNDLKEMVIEQIKSMIITQVITAGVKWIIGLLNPVGALIKAAIAIYDIVIFFVEKGKQILTLVESVVDSVAAIAKGDLGGAATMVENALAKAVPLVIGLLANLLGIGGLAKKVQDIIGKIRSRIDKAIDGLINKARSAASKLLGKGKGGTVKADETKDGEAEWWKARTKFTSSDGKTHELFYQGKDKSAVPMIACGSTTSVKEKATSWKTRASGKDATPAMKSALPEISQLAQLAATQPDSPQILSLLKSLSNIFGAETASADDLLNLDAPPVKLPRTKEEEKEHLKAVEQVTRKLMNENDDTEDLQKHFPTIQKRYQLTSFGYVFQNGKPRIEAKINPVTDIEVKDEAMKGRFDSGIKTEVKWSTGKLGGSTVGMKMEAKPLGPDHPQGHGPKSSAQQALMDQLVTEPKNPANAKFIKGHLLNDNVGGPGDDYNLFPITGYANGEHERSFESKVKEWVNKDRYWVNYTVEVKNVSDNLKGTANISDNYVNATFSCRAAILNTDMKETKILTANIVSKYLKNEEAKDVDEKDMGLGDGAKEKRDIAILESSAKGTETYTLDDGLYSVITKLISSEGTTNAKEEVKKAINNTSGLGDASFSLLWQIVTSGNNADRSTILKTAEKGTLTSINHNAIEIQENLKRKKAKASPPAEVNLVI